MSQPVHIWFEETQEDGEVVRRLVCESVVDPGAPRLDLWWRIPGIPSLPTPPVLDSLLGGPLLWAAMSGQDVVVQLSAYGRELFTLHGCRKARA